MSKLTIPGLAAALVFSALPALAVDEHHPDQNKPTVKADVVQKMQANTKKMQTQLDRITKAKTDEERRQAMAEHMRTMQENMMMARGMQGGMKDCPMMESGMMSQGMMSGGASPGDMAERMRQMERRMDMMQMMMEQTARGREDNRSNPPMMQR